MCNQPFTTRGILLSLAVVMPRPTAGMAALQLRLASSRLSSVTMQYSGGGYGYDSGGGYGQSQHGYGQQQGYWNPQQGYGSGEYDEGGYTNMQGQPQQGPPKYGAPQDYRAPVLWSLHALSGLTGFSGVAEKYRIAV